MSVNMMAASRRRDSVTLLVLLLDMLDAGGVGVRRETYAMITFQDSTVSSDPNGNTSARRLG